MGESKVTYRRKVVTADSFPRKAFMPKMDYVTIQWFHILGTSFSQFILPKE